MNNLAYYYASRVVEFCQKSVGGPTTFLLLSTYDFCYHIHHPIIDET